MTTSLITNTVFTGTTPNDGTGENIRNAFNQINYNVSNIAEFLSAPTITNVIVSNSLTVNGPGVFANIQVLANTASTSSSTGALTIVNGVGIGGNLNVGGTISGTISSTSITAGTVTTTGILTTYGDVLFAGNTTSLTGNLDVGGNTVINGSLTVHGNMISISTSEYIIEMPTIELGKVANMSLGSNDGRDRGIEFFWYDEVASAQKEGFFGFDNSSQKFTFIPRSSYIGTGDSDIFAGTPGTAVFGTVEANVIATGDSTFDTLTANTVTANTGFTGNLLTAYQPNVTQLGTLSNLSISGGNADVTNGNVNVTTGDVFVTGGTVKIWDGVSAYIPVGLSTSSFQGGPVANDTQFLATTASIDTVTGAVRINGGLGVGGNVNVGGNFTTVGFSATTLSGTLTTAAQPNITSVGTLGNLAVAGNISATTLGVTNISATNTVAASTLSASTGISGPLTTAAQPNITSVGTLSSLSVAGNITATKFTGLVTGNVTGNVTGSAATVTSAAQPAITSVGTLTSLDVTGTATVGNLNVGTGTIQTTGNITTTGNVVSSFLYGTLRTPTQASITSLGTLSSVVVSGNSSLVGTTTIGTGLSAASTLVTVGTSSNRFGTVYTTALNSSGIATTGGVNTSANVSISTPGTGILFSDGSYLTTAVATTATNIAGGVAGGIVYQSAPGATSISTVGTTGQFLVSNGNAAPSWVSSAASVGVTEINTASTFYPIFTSASGSGVPLYVDTVTSPLSYTPSTGTLVATTFSGSLSGNATNITGTYAGTITSGQVVAGLGFTPYSNANPSGYIAAGGAPVQSVAGLTGAPTAAQVAAAISGQTMNISGNATTAGSITSQANSATITAASTNTASTIVLRDASGNFSAGVMTATATQAQYADLAEMYQSDGQYDAGTVLVFGGRKEVTTTGHQADVAVAGVVSTAPAYLMNIDAVDAVAVALRGKVPVKLVGPVRKGDLLVTSYISGYAVSVGREASYGVAIFAKSLEEDLSEGQKLINAVII